MKEFLLIIRNESAQKASLPPAEHDAFLRKCEAYIDWLAKAGKLKAAQPMERKGVLLSGTKGNWKDEPCGETGRVIVGYYHLLANDLEEAVAMAKENPEFEYGTTASIEVRPLKMKEATTGYTYPTRN
jgi:hypothetical protein